MEAAAWLAARTALVDAYLDAVLPSADEPPRALHAAMRHLIFPGGKRLRPAFAFAACEAAGAAHDAALPAAAAVELVHTYSLIHDDLPCMDDDALRRGRPSVHVAYGEAIAVLAGDALLAQAFAVLARAAEKAPSAVVAAAMQDLAHAAGSLELVGGQADDLDFEAGGAEEAARVEGVHRRKSAALIAAALTTGARLGGAEPALVERLGSFGREVGIAFQIADDLLDRDDGEACSLVRVLGAEAARARAEELLSSALRRVEPLGSRAEPLRELARLAVRRER